MQLDDLQKMVELTKTFNATHKDEVMREAYKHRFKNTAISAIIVLVCAGGIFAAFWYRSHFSALNWYILVTLLGLFLTIAFIIFINYIVIIIKKKPPFTP